MSDEAPLDASTPDGAAEFCRRTAANLAGEYGAEMLAKFEARPITVGLPADVWLAVGGQPDVVAPLPPGFAWTLATAEQVAAATPRPPKSRAARRAERFDRRRLN